MELAFVDAVGVDGDYYLELRKVPTLRCRNDHETREAAARFDLQLLASLYKSEVPIGEEVNSSDRSLFACPNCGDCDLNLTVAQSTRDIQIEIPTLGPFEVHLSCPFVGCLKCSQSFLLPRKDGKTLGRALGNALRAGGLEWKSQKGDSLKFGIALALFVFLLVLWLTLFARSFMWLRPHSQSALEGILVILLMVFGFAGTLFLCVISWMLLSRPFLREDLMLQLLFSSGLKIPLWDRFFRWFVEVLY